MSEILETARRLDELADGIRARLNALDMSALAIARSIGLGSDNTIRDFLRGKIKVTPTTLERIERWLDERSDAA